MFGPTVQQPGTKRAAAATTGNRQIIDRRPRLIPVHDAQCCFQVLEQILDPGTLINGIANAGHAIHHRIIGMHRG